MAKDSYHVIMCRILIYLYACMREGVEFNPDEVSFERLGVCEKYWTSIVVNMLEKGYLKGAAVIPVLRMGKRIKWDDPQITQEGVEFIEENSAIAKAKEFLKTLKEIVPGM